MSKKKDVQDPFELFRQVYDQAAAEDVTYPNAMVVSTVGEGGRPSSRVMLLKGFDEHGFVFYTNFESRKGREILENPHVALNFYWQAIGKQVRVEGKAERVSDEEADAYFATRPHGSKVGAWASRQSRPMSGRAELLKEVARVELEFKGRVPRPPHWSGFRVVPERIEFWTEGKFRLHDRQVFERDGEGWKSSRLFP